MQVATLQKANGAGISFDLPTAGASVASKFWQRAEARLAGKQIHRIAASLTFADHLFTPGC
jgi:hypothetical protein